MASEIGVPLGDLVGNPTLVHRVRFDQFVDDEKGLRRFTLDDIKTELERPGRDPRPRFKTPELRDDVTSIEDLKAGMQLEGRVSNVTNFGAFVGNGVARRAAAWGWRSEERKAPGSGHRRRPDAVVQQVVAEVSTP